MGTKLILFLIIHLFTISILFGQDTGELHLHNNKLKGECSNQYFTGFEIELDTVYEKVDSAILFDQLTRVGHLHFKNRKWIKTEFVKSNRLGFAEIMFRFKSEWHTFKNVRFTDKALHFTLDSDPVLLPSEADLEIIQLALSVLSSEKYWNQKDDRNCTDDISNKCYSLYCAIRMASLEIENRYNHRNAVLQKVRHAIDEAYPNNEWGHRLMDFNNAEDTSYDDIIKFLKSIELDFAASLDR